MRIVIDVIVDSLCPGYEILVDTRHDSITY